MNEGDNMDGLIDHWIEKYYYYSKNNGKSDREISEELGISERTLRIKKRHFT